MVVTDTNMPNEQVGTEDEVEYSWAQHLVKTGYWIPWN
jgi:hypothetical protein